MKKNWISCWLVTLALPMAQTGAQIQTPVPPDLRGRSDAERSGTHDANNIRTVFWNYGMVGDYPSDPIGVDLSTFHSVEVPKGTGMNYSDGVTPFVLAKVKQRDGSTAFIMETGYRERQGQSPRFNRIMRFEPRPGYFEADPAINQGRSPAVSNDPRTWPAKWPDKDSTWNGAWNGYFGQRPAADLESFTVMDDDYYDAWQYYPDSRDLSRRGLGLRIEVRGFQWANPQSGNVIFWHYDITNEGTTDYPLAGEEENIIFGLYMDSGVGGSAVGCDPVPESDDDNAYFDRSSGLNLVYTWDTYGHGRNLTSICAPTGYLGYAYLETPGKPFDGVDNDQDGIIDEQRDGGPGQLIEGQSAIAAYVNSQYTSNFRLFYGRLEERPAFRAGRWWTGDEDMDWVADLNDVGADGVRNTNDLGEGDGIPTDGETNFDKTDINESDQIGLTGFKMNRIRSVSGGPVDGIVFFTNSLEWPQRLYEKFTHPVPSARFDSAVVSNYNIGFLFASGPFTLRAARTERFSLALAYGADLQELRNTVKVVQAIYNANYQFATPPPVPTVRAEAGDGYVQLSWDDAAEKGVDPVTLSDDFEGYRVYRSTDPDFLDVKVILTGRGTNTIGNGRPSAQFDRVNGIQGFSNTIVEGVAYYLGNESGLVHSYRDTTVTNGQEYYYAVTAYDNGPAITLNAQGEIFEFYPSENAITVSRTLRGGTILPKNIVAVRPNPRVLGYTPADASQADRMAGTGVGSVSVEVLNSKLVPDNHLFKITFDADRDSVHAQTYTLTDSTTGEAIFTSANDFTGLGRGLEGAGVLPVVYSIEEVEIDTTKSGFASGSPTNAKGKVRYIPSVFLPKNFKREGFPFDIRITFANTYLDTSVFALPIFPKPAKFKIEALTPQGPKKLKFIFFDFDNDGTLSIPDTSSTTGEYIDILTGPDSLIANYRITWRVQLDSTGQRARGTLRPPAEGDVYNLKLRLPIGVDDAFTFSTTGLAIAEDKAKEQFNNAPYVVPNPYVGAASFEPSPFGVSGRGDRRLEFRGLPQNCTIRIYTVRGELVQTLRHDNSLDGYVAWDLRTKDNLDVAPGLYVYHVDAGPAGNHIGKFAIIK
jgi:hypothetical protein